MGPRSIRVLAVLSTLIVVAGGTLFNRNLFLEQTSSYRSWSPEPVAVEGPDVVPVPAVPDPAPREIVVDAGPGVRVRVEGQTGVAGFAAETRAWFAHAQVTSWDSPQVVARCQTPLPVLSQCAIWISVTTASAADTVTILEHAGSIVDRTAPPNVAVRVEAAG